MLHSYVCYVVVVVVVCLSLLDGAGFSTHQDTPAYIGLASDHISVMVAIDAATKENGCLQVCRGKFYYVKWIY